MSRVMTGYEKEAAAAKEKGRTCQELSPGQHEPARGHDAHLDVEGRLATVLQVILSHSVGRKGTVKQPQATSNVYSLDIT